MPVLSDVKKKLILFLALALGVAHLIPVFTGEEYYPFVKYEMFAHRRPKPVYKSFIVDVDVNENSSTPASYFYPFNRRGLSFTISNALSTINYAQVLHLFEKVFHARSIQPEKLKLYSVSCACEKFKISELDVNSFIKSENCELTLLSEKHVQKN